MFMYRKSSIQIWLCKLLIHPGYILYTPIYMYIYVFHKITEVPAAKIKNKKRGGEAFSSIFAVKIIFQALVRCCKVCLCKS